MKRIILHKWANYFTSYLNVAMQQNTSINLLPKYSCSTQVDCYHKSRFITNLSRGLVTYHDSSFITNHDRADRADVVEHHSLWIRQGEGRGGVDFLARH